MSLPSFCHYWNEGRRLLREKWEAAQLRPRKASACSGYQRLYFVSGKRKKTVGNLKIQ